MGLLCDRCGALYANNLHASFFTLKNMNGHIQAGRHASTNRHQQWWLSDTKQSMYWMMKEGYRKGTEPGEKWRIIFCEVLLRHFCSDYMMMLTLIVMGSQTFTYFWTSCRTKYSIDPKNKINELMWNVWWTVSVCDYWTLIYDLKFRCNL